MNQWNDSVLQKTKFQFLSLKKLKRIFLFCSPCVLFLAMAMNTQAQTPLFSPSFFIQPDFLENLDHREKTEAALSIEAEQAALIPQNLTSIDLRDLIQFSSATTPPLLFSRIIIETISQHTNWFVPLKVPFTARGPSTKLGEKIEAAIYSVVFDESQPTPQEQSTSLLIHYSTGAQEHFIRKFSIPFVTEAAQLAERDIRVIEEIPLNQTQFELEIALIERQATLTDSIHHLRFVYPLGVGGFDEGVLSGNPQLITLLTPLFKNATLDRNTAISARHDKPYYAYKPFLRITRNDGEYTPIGIHIVQHPDRAPNGPDYNYMVRGFDSHGCLRLREKDLYELFSVLMNHSKKSLGINVRLQSKYSIRHPYPLRNSKYVAVVNFGTADHPEYRRDEKDHLVIMAEKKGPPPIAQLMQKEFITVTPKLSLNLIDGDKIDVSHLNELTNDPLLNYPPASKGIQ